MQSRAVQKKLEATGDYQQHQGGMQWVCPVAIDWPLGPVINQVRPKYGGRVLNCTTAGRDVKCTGRTERTYTDGKRELPEKGGLLTGLKTCCKWGFVSRGHREGRWLVDGE